MRRSRAGQCASQTAVSGQTTFAMKRIVVMLCLVEFVPAPAKAGVSLAGDVGLPPNTSHVRTSVDGHDLGWTITRLEGTAVHSPVCAEPILQEAPYKDSPSGHPRGPDHSPVVVVIPTGLNHVKFGERVCRSLFEFQVRAAFL